MNKLHTNYLLKKNAKIFGMAKHILNIVPTNNDNIYFCTVRIHLTTSLRSNRSCLSGHITLTINCNIGAFQSYKVIIFMNICNIFSFSPQNKFVGTCTIYILLRQIGCVRTRRRLGQVSGYPIGSDNGLISQKLLLKSKFY